MPDYPTQTIKIRKGAYDELKRMKESSKIPIFEIVEKLVMAKAKKQKGGAK